MKILGSRNTDLSFASPEALASLRKQNLGVDWHLPGAKRRFATTTRATSEMIVELAGDTLTFAQALDAVNFDVDAKIVLEHFCNSGYADELVAKYVS